MDKVKTKIHSFRPTTYVGKHIFVSTGDPSSPTIVKMYWAPEGKRYHRFPTQYPSQRRSLAQEINHLKLRLASLRTTAQHIKYRFRSTPAIVKSADSILTELLNLTSRITIAHKEEAACLSRIKSPRRAPIASTSTGSPNPPSGAASTPISKPKEHRTR